MLKKILTILLILLCIVGCSTEKQKENDKPVTKDLSTIYTEIEGECKLKESTPEEIKTMLTAGSGVIFLSWEECPWCHGYVNFINESAIQNNLEVLYYDIYNDRENKTEFYNYLLERLQSELLTSMAVDADGNLKVYVPAVIYVAKGEIVGFDNWSSMESDFEENYTKYWEEEVVWQNGMNIISGPRSFVLKEKLKSWSDCVSCARKETEEQGCDSYCKIGGK